MKIKVYGCSDDLVEIEGADVCRGKDVSKGGDEIGAYASGANVVNLTFNVGEKLRVYAMYADRGCWCFAVGQVDEDTPIPDWDIRILQSRDCDYSAELSIDTRGDDVTIAVEGQEDDI